ncbi:MAG: peptidyl-prolyl cis-trans isomerase [Comamonadaceae bacterium]|nr:MAG: peptidyl-prolyl cis-trans isomerase [Comamonadaceae bacterium]
MFDFIRKHTKVTMGLLFLLIVPSFVLFGLDGYSRDKDKGVVVAKVDGQEIIQSQWDQAHQREVERLRASMPSLDPKLLDSPEARYATLERLVRERVLTAAASKFKLVTSDQRLARDLQENPEIAALRRADGTLDIERYRQLLGSQGLSPEMFEANVRAELSSRQVLMGVAGSGFSPKFAADTALNAYFEKRDIQVARFSASEYAAKLTPTDADLEQYYKSNEAQFQAPEQADIEYVLLDVDTLRKGITVNEDELKAYYDQNAQRLSGNEERRASHILITAPKSAPAAERQQAKAKADALLAQLRKSPDTFADLARKNSQDPGSAPNGGDLDFFARGAMVKPFEDAAFAMKKGDISDVIESEFGYHIIRLTDIKAPKQRTFAEMRTELEADVKKQQAQKKFSESADAFSNGVYEQADSLKPVADRLKLEIRTATGVTRQPKPGVTGALANPKFLNAIFAPDATQNKRNTEALEVASNQLVSGRVTKYTPARTLPLAEVKDSVRQRWLATRGAEEARKEGAAKLAAWKANPASAVLTETTVASRDQTQAKQLAAPIVDAALKANASSLPAFAGVDLGAQGYAVVKILKVLPRDTVAPEIATQERGQYGQWWTAAESQAYYNILKERFKADIKVTKPAPAGASTTVATQ